MLRSLIRFLIRLQIQRTKQWQRWLQDISNRLSPPKPPPPTCPIGWQPSALAPVFYGVRDYGTADAAPGSCRVFFPSLDAAVFNASILEGCGRYPLILFAHGDCNEIEHYKKWYNLPAQLARSGYVVAAPEMPNISAHPSLEGHQALSRMAEIVAWMRGGWEHRNVLLPSVTGVAGHSYGALLAARFAAANAVSAYTSIAGVWEDWPTGPLPIERLAIPMLLCLGTNDQFTNISSPLWSALALPKHRAVFEGALHWDYLQPGATSCENGRGPCTLTGMLTVDLVTMFFAKYLPPENWPILGSQIPANLIPPARMLTVEQEFYAGAHLYGFSLLGSRPGCQVTLAWENSGGSGNTTLP